MPNVFWLIFPPPANSCAVTVSGRSNGKLMEMLEGAGRIAVCVVPFFYHIETEGSLTVVALAVVGAALSIYYAGWIRFFLKGRAYRLLYIPLLGLPVPMAVSPVVFFLAASIPLRSVLLLASAVALGIGHISLSWLEYRWLISDAG
jgi:hypothetical protein